MQVTSENGKQEMACKMCAKIMPAAIIAITTGTASETLYPASSKDTNQSIPKTSAYVLPSNCLQHLMPLLLLFLFGKLPFDDLAQSNSFFLGESNKLPHARSGNLSKLSGFGLAYLTAKSKSAGSYLAPIRFIACGRQIIDCRGKACEVNNQRQEQFTPPHHIPPQENIAHFAGAATL
jgi:hypothetical protein